MQKLTNPHLSNRRKKLQKNWIGLRAYASKQILHMDVTIFRPSDHSRVYLYFILDNFSRAILGRKASLQYSSEVALENLKEVCEKYDLSNSSVQLVVDDGPENKFTEPVSKFNYWPFCQLDITQDFIYSRLSWHMEIAPNGSAFVKGMTIALGSSKPKHFSFKRSKIRA